MSDLRPFTVVLILVSLVDTGAVGADQLIALPAVPDALTFNSKENNELVIVDGSKQTSRPPGNTGSTSWSLRKKAQVLLHFSSSPTKHQDQIATAPRSLHATEGYLDSGNPKTQAAPKALSGIVSQRSHSPIHNGASIATRETDPNQSSASAEDRRSTIQQGFADRLRQLSKHRPSKTPHAIAPASDNAGSVRDTLAETEDKLPTRPGNAAGPPGNTVAPVRIDLYNSAFAPAVVLASGERSSPQIVPTPPSSAFPGREKIVFRPAVVDVNHDGQPVLRPDVLLASRDNMSKGGVTFYASDDSESLPSGVPEPAIPEEWAETVVDGAYMPSPEYAVECAPRLGPCQVIWARICARLDGPCGCEKGLGTERVFQAISFLDTTQPMNNFRMRFDAGYDYRSPDRAEYFWARINGRGPSGAPSVNDVDYQDIRTYIELGDKKFSVGTDVPIRLIDPDTFANHSGIGDVNITTKVLFLDGKDWQIANLFRVYIPSGNPATGLGVGHTSIEPGFAIRYKWSDYTYFHGNLKYWVPLGGDPNFAGEILNYGLAMSHVWRETDSFAVMPTLEVLGYSFFNGLSTPPGAAAVPPVNDADGVGVAIIHPGIRWAWDHGSDCGLREVGLFGGFSLTSNSLYEELLRLEFRWIW